MDQRVARLKTSKDALVLAGNAQWRGNTLIETQALSRAKELKAAEEGFVSPVEQAIAFALYAYEEEMTRLKGRSSPANRIRGLFAKLGPLPAVEALALRRPSSGFAALEKAGSQELSFETVLDRFPEFFSEAAVFAARSRLAGQALGFLDISSVDIEDGSPPVADDVARRMFEGFNAPDLDFYLSWKPRYQQTVDLVREAIARGQTEDIFDLVWKTKDNNVSNAGSGMPSFALIDALKDKLLAVIETIAEDASPECFDAIVERFTKWRQTGELKAIPRLLIARAFATLHPEFYPTTVDATVLDKALEWFRVHTGLATLDSENWAFKARWLSQHLDSLWCFNDDLQRNMFPWFVLDQIRGYRQVGEPEGAAPDYKPRPSSAYAELPASVRKIRLRHNDLQEALYKQLCQIYPKEQVWCERPTGSGGYADMLVTRPGAGCLIYEIKVSHTALGAVREALGQLLEYAYVDSEHGFEADELIIVAEPELDSKTAEYLARLNAQFQLKLRYQHLIIPTDQ
ncbi:hypothetical protein [Pseudomonas gingeri]|uniref:Uncharacterized protein n=1 Tax=Pseudomonas gingeri TaxID=117681 RepID=A0A7Y7WSI6_9PSED|nr:hypothetical protein [Pseudomonas gingeri]NWB86954.1 hypothetical protein [Pseudomonas gingeri]